MEPAQISQVRSFNRLVTQKVGALDQSYLSRGRPLGEARLLFEAGLSEGVDVRELRRRLNLDAGYLSRLLRALERQDLIKVQKNTVDGRVRLVRLTSKGKAEFAAYDALSNQLAESLLSPLNERQRLRLVAAMNDVERLLKAGSIEIAVEEPSSAGAQWCLGSYYDELARRFENGFDAEAAKRLDLADMKQPAGALLLARIDGSPVGCGALKDLGAGVCEIKRLWVADSARGVGLATRLLASLEEMARGQGFDRVRLDTNRTLGEAQSLYRKSGYREIARYNDNPYADHWFEKNL